MQPEANIGSNSTLLIGGQSCAGIAFRRLAAASGLGLTTLVRRPCAAIGPERLVEVRDYFQLAGDLLAGAQTVVNFTGITSGPALEEVNVVGPVRLATQAAEHGVRHFVQVSSLSVYGHTDRISRDTPEAPVTAYGRSKQWADTALRGLESERFAVTLLRVPMLYGDGAGDKIFSLAKLMRLARFFPVPSEPVRRSFLHVENLAVLVRSLVRRPVSGVCFGADADSFTMELLADVIAEVNGRRPALLHLPKVAFLPLRIAAPGLYAKLYQSSYVERSDCLVPDEPFPVLLRQGLADMLLK